MTMYGTIPEYGQRAKSWQKIYKISLYYNYEDKLKGNTCLLLVSMRFLRIASGMKGHYSLCRYYKRLKEFDKGFKT